MAAIPRYEASVGLRSPGIPDTRLISPDGAALEGVGNAIQRAADIFANRNEQRENFKAANDARKFELDLNQGLIDSEANAPEDGAGFHDGFIENVYRPRRDEFLAKLPPRLRPRYEEMFADDTGAGATEWSMKAAGKERDIASTWVKNELGITQDQLATAISRDPNAYDAFYQSGVDLIDEAPMLTAMERRQAKQAWSEMAQTAYLNRLMEDDPQLVLRELGANANKLSPSTQFEVLSAAVQQQETGANPNQISPMGAIGSHQVMPGTAREIAKEIGDTNFPFKGDPFEVTEYLLRPGMSKRYGDFYLKKMMKKYPNDMEAALIAYNGGPGRADAWLKAGRDDSVLPRETANYYKQVRERMPGLIAPGSRGAAAAGQVEFVFNREGMAAISGQSLDKLNPDLVSRTSEAFASLGITKVKVNSGFRSPHDNERVGGAKKSQHLSGSAMDIDVSGYTNAQRLDILRALSAKGITGLGIGANVIHADVGGRRTWGYPNIPKYAQAFAAEHELNRTVAPRTGGGRFSTLPYDKRQTFIAAADQKLSNQLTAASRASAADKVLVRQDLNNELAVIEKTGLPTGTFDETRIATVLGEDDYLTYSARKLQATKTFTAKDGIALMSPQEMEERVNAYEADPSSDTFDSDQKVHAAVVKEVDRITKLRAQEPAKAAAEFPDVREALVKANTSITEGKPDSQAIQQMTALLMERQKMFGIPEKAMQPVPREWAFEIGKTLTEDIPVRSKEVSAEAVRAEIAVQYNAIRQLFGDFADEVILYALSEYKGMDKATAAQVTALMGAVAAGKPDPFKQNKRPEEAVVEEPSFFSREYWFGSSTPSPDEENPAAEQAEEAEPPSPELVERAARALRDIETPDDEAAIVLRYGQAAVDAAKFKMEQGATE